MQTLVDIDLFAEIRRIKGALEHHSCSEALTWCNENKASLRKIKVGTILSARCEMITNNMCVAL